MKIYLALAILFIVLTACKPTEYQTPCREECLVRDSCKVDSDCVVSCGCQCVSGASVCPGSTGSGTCPKIKQECGCIQGACAYA